jgi:hypothetical protein
VVFLFYYSGHGESDALELGSSRLPIGRIRALLRDAPASMRLGIVDACHSGALLRSKGGRRAEAFPLSVEDEMTSRGYAILTSSAEGESSHESDELRSSFFTHYLASGLRGDADFSQDQRVTLGELYQYAYHATVKRSQLVPGSQHPHFESAQRGDMVLTQLGLSASLLTFPKAMDGEYLLFDPRTDTVVAEVLKRAGTPRSIAVRPGQLQIYERTDRGLRRATVDVGEREEVVIDPSSMVPTETAEYALRGPELAIGLGARVGYQMFHDPAFTDRYIGDTPMYGLGLSLMNVGIPNLDLTFDALFTVADQDLQLSGVGVEQNLFQFVLGTTLAWRFQWADLHLSVGPRIAWVLFKRRIAEAGLAHGDRDQVFTTATPGASVELGYRILPHFQLAAVAQTSFLRFQADSETRDVATTSVFLSLVYAF